MISFILNREDASADLPPGRVVLDFLRQQRGLSGTKEGCREGDCGACMVLVGRPERGAVRYEAVNSCLLPAGELPGRHLVTIEGLNAPALSAVQQAFLDEGATQCGFCTPGFIVALTGFLLSAPRISLAGAIDAVAGNICRCTGYASIRRAIGRLCDDLAAAPGVTPEDGGLAERLDCLVRRGVVPSYLLEIPRRLSGVAATPAAECHEGRTEFPVVAGGTDLFVQRPEHLADAERLAFLSRREDLRGIKRADGYCEIGAATPLADLEDSPLLRDHVPGLNNCWRLISSRPIRHRATVAGNIVNASPIGDLTVLLLAFDAAATLSNGASRRDVPLRDFFLGYKKLDRREDELLLRVRFPLPAPGTVFSFEKVSRRTHLDIASVNSAMQVRMEDDRVAGVHLSAGGVAPVPLYLRRTVRRLTGSALSPDTVRDALEEAQQEISPISDVRGSADYKRVLLRQLLMAHFLKVRPDLESTLPS